MNENLREKILLRDNFQCTDFNHAGPRATSNDLVVHHIDNDQTNNRKRNLTTLCRTCHQRHTNRYRMLARRLAEMEKANPTPVQLKLFSPTD